MTQRHDWYEATHRDGTRWLARKSGEDVELMAARGLTVRHLTRAEAAQEYTRGEVYHDQDLADEQYRLARALERVRPQGGRYALAA